VLWQLLFFLSFVLASLVEDMAKLGGKAAAVRTLGLAEEAGIGVDRMDQEMLEVVEVEGGLDGAVQ